MDWSVPVVLAGNAAVRDEVAAVLRDGGLPVSEADNVLPDIGRLDPESARTAIREVFLEHVIGGDRLSTDPRLRQWVRAVTPGRGPGGGLRAGPRLRASAEVPGVVVLDVGGATTDVYCVPDPDAEQATLGREAVGVPARRRTVEGDLGVFSSVADLRAAAVAEGLTPGDDPLSLGEAAATVALRRHLRAEAAYGPGGAGARGVGLVVLSGGVFRHADPEAVDGVVARLAADRGGAGSVLTGTRVVVDRRYVLAAAGLLAADHPEAAAGAAQGAGRVMIENSAPNGSVIVASRP